MGVAFQEDALGRNTARVGADHRPGPGDVAADILFGHQKINGVDPAVVLDDEVDDRVLWAGAAHPGDLRQRLAGKRLQLVVLEAGQQDIFGSAGVMQKVLPADGGRAHFRSEEHTSELQSLMRISYAVFCLKKKIENKHKSINNEM